MTARRAHVCSARLRASCGGRALSGSTDRRHEHSANRAVGRVTREFDPPTDPVVLDSEDRDVPGVRHHHAGVRPGLRVHAPRLRLAAPTSGRRITPPASSRSSTTWCSCVETSWSTCMRRTVKSIVVPPSRGRTSTVPSSRRSSVLRSSRKWRSSRVTSTNGRGELGRTVGAEPTPRAAQRARNSRMRRATAPRPTAAKPTAAKPTAAKPTAASPWHPLSPPRSRSQHLLIAVGCLCQDRRVSSNGPWPAPDRSRHPPSETYARGEADAW